VVNIQFSYMKFTIIDCYGCRFKVVIQKVRHYLAVLNSVPINLKGLEFFVYSPPSGYRFYGVPCRFNVILRCSNFSII